MSKTKRTIKKEEWLKKRIDEMFRKAELDRLNTVYHLFKKKAKICPTCNGAGVVVEELEKQCL